MMRSTLAFGLILLLTLLVRLPFFFPAVVDWDESTFILIGQSILDGHLPYAHLWDVKPPLLFAVFAAAIAVFGHSIEGVRFAGALCVAATAWFVYLIVERWWGRSAAWLGAILSLLMCTLIASGQATMSEHVALPAVMAALYLHLGQARSLARDFATGALLAVATLIRLNIAYVVLAVGLLVVDEAGRRQRSIVRAVAAYSAGVVIVVALASLPFALAGQLTLLWRSAVIAALVRSNVSAETSRVGRILSAAFRMAGEGSDVSWLGLFLWVGALAGLIAAWHRSKTGSEVHAGIRRVSIVGAALGAGIVMSGDMFGHYFIQLVPFAAIAVAALANCPIRAVRTSVWALALGFAVVSMRPVAEEYQRMASRAFAGEGLHYGPAYALADYMKRENPSGRPVLLLTDHVAHWLTSSEPPTRFVTHPSTLSRDDVLEVMGTTGRNELTRILNLAPEIVVINREQWFPDGDARDRLETTLASDYAVAAEIEGREIYRRTAARLVR